ncbi:MAG TPA: sialidase family protein [bacterium]|nr:sialidase family protein [bacterium]
MRFQRIVGGVLALLLVMGIMSGTMTSQPIVPKTNLALEHAIRLALGQMAPKPHEQSLSSGVVQAGLHARYGEGALPGAVRRAATQSSLSSGIVIRTLGCPNVFTGRFNNIRVNQDCSFQRQAEEMIAVDRGDPTHLIAGQNDSRIGYNHCGIDYSFDRGQHWGDQLPPFYQYILNDGHTADAASDPMVVFDSRSNAYFGCVVFDVVAAANGIVITKSNAAFGGAFFHTPAPGPTQSLSNNPPGVVANDNDPAIFNDKPFMAADAHPGSPKRDNVYVTWTRFRSSPDGLTTFESPIYFAQSTNGGATFSPGVEISGTSDACVLGNLFDLAEAANECNFDQGSWPVAGPDGTLYVFFNNNNTPTLVAQQMMVKCLGTADCTKSANWVGPFKIADDFDTQPFSAPIAGCGADRQCLPPNGYRVNDYGAGAIDPTGEDGGRLYFSWSDFRNAGPCATDSDGFPVEPCGDHNNDVFIASSNDGGQTWSSPRLVSNDDESGAAQWQSWMAVGPDGTIYIAYYDRQFGCESTGCNDITLAVSTNRGRSFRHFRLTTASMPNLTDANNPMESGFLGDHIGVAANASGAYVVWADTRPRAGTVPEEDVYYVFFPRSTVGKPRDD